MKRSAIRGYQIGAVLGLALLIVLFLPGQERSLARGPANTGRATVECQACHVAAPGTTRQQIQANIRYWLGQRQQPVPFQHQSVTNEACFACHDNPKDAHPVDRFNEPRFVAARAAIQPQNCVACHQEHQGVRVTTTPIMCVHCHQDTILQNDPLDVSHASLISANKWDTCLTCHDFHANHAMTVPTRVADALDPARVWDYFQGGPSPYSDRKFFAAKKGGAP